MSYNPYYMRTPATGQLEPLIPNLGQQYAEGVKSGVDIQKAPFQIQEEAARAQQDKAIANQDTLKALFSFAGPASYGILTAEDKDKPQLYQQFRTQVASMFPQLGQSMPNEWNDQAEKYTTQTYQESQQVKDLMLRNIIAQQTGAHGVDLSHVLPATEAAQQAGAMGAQGQIPGQSPVGADWLGLAGSAMFGGGTGFEMARAAVEPSIQGTRSQYDMIKVTAPDGTEHYVPKSALLGVPGATGIGGTQTVPPNLPSTAGTAPQPATTGAPAQTGTTPTLPVGGASQPFIPDGGTLLPGEPALGQAPVAGLSPASKKLMEGAATNALEWQKGINEKATAAKTLAANLDAAEVALQGFNPSAAQSTKMKLEQAMNYVTGGTYTGELPSLQEFNKAMMESVRQAVRQTSSRAAVQEFKMIQQTFPTINFPSRDTADFLLNIQRASNVDMPIMAQQFAQKWEASHPGTGIIGAQEKWNQYANPFAIALMRMPQDQANLYISELSKTPQGKALIGSWVKSEQFFNAAGLTSYITGQQ